MFESSAPALDGGPAKLLLTLRHALSDPLSSVALKLDLVERRALSPSGAEASWLAQTVRAAQADVGAANRLVDLLLRLAEIAGERPASTSLAELCRVARVELETDAVIPSLLLRPRSSADAIQAVASFVGERSATVARARLESGRVVLLVAGPGPRPIEEPERLLSLPHGLAEAEALFVARAAVEADDGRLELTGSAGDLVARFSWPVADAKESR
jgi:hypothetical protein